MSITVIFGATAMVGARRRLLVGPHRHAIEGASEPLRSGSPNRQHLLIGAASIMRRVGIAARRVIPHQLVDGLEVKLVQAGHPYGLDLARLLGIKLMLSLGSAFLLILIGQPVFGLISAPVLFFLPDYWVMSLRRSARTPSGARPRTLSIS